MRPRFLVSGALAIALIALAAAPAFAQRGGGSRFNRFGDSAPRVGESAPDFNLDTDTGESFDLGEVCDETPVLLFFGSCT